MPDAVSIPVARHLPKFRDPRLDVLRGANKTGWYGLSLDHGKGAAPRRESKT